MPSHPFSDPAGQAAVAARIGAAPEAVSYRQLARGVSHDTLIVSVDGSPRAVLRLAPPRAEILPRLQPAEEGRLFELLAGSGLPVPEALIVDRDGTRLGRPGLLMSYQPGENALTWAEMEERGGAGAIDHAFATIVAMHSLPVPVEWPQAGEPEGHAELELAGVRRLAGEAGEGAPAELLAAASELAAAVPAPSGPPCIVHGDFRPANLMASGGAITGILDWEMAGTGDPACDFGISTMREWGEWYPDAELLDRYRAARGVEIELASLLWWRALGYVKVVAFLACRMTEGWRGPDLDRWVAAMQRALAEWR